MRPLTNLYDNQKNRGKEDPGSLLQNPLPERQAPMQTTTIHSLTLRKPPLPSMTFIFTDYFILPEQRSRDSRSNTDT